MRLFKFGFKLLMLLMLTLDANAQQLNSSTFPPPVPKGYEFRAFNPTVSASLADIQFIASTAYDIISQTEYSKFSKMPQLTSRNRIVIDSLIKASPVEITKNKELILYNPLIDLFIVIRKNSGGRIIDTGFVTGDKLASIYGISSKEVDPIVRNFKERPFLHRLYAASIERSGPGHGQEAIAFGKTYKKDVRERKMIAAKILQLWSGVSAAAEDMNCTSAISVKVEDYIRKLPGKGMPPVISESFGLIGKPSLNQEGVYVYADTKYGRYYIMQRIQGSGSGCQARDAVLVYLQY